MNKKKCILCNQGKIKSFVNLGFSALANNLISLKDYKKKEKKYPLILGKCERCDHVQLRDLVSPKYMFDNYLYLSSASSTLQKHLNSIPEIINKLKKIKKNDLVIDIGSNDATLLKGYNKFKARTLGIEPAKNLSKYYKKNNINLIGDYFNVSTANKIKKKYGLAKIITATNVFPHLQNLKDFAKSVNILLDDGGILLIEAHYLKNLLDDVAFDTIYHEHCSYWSIKAVQKYFEMYDLELFNVDRLPIHHGQIRCWIGKKGVRKLNNNLKKLLKNEKKDKIYNDSTLLDFGKKTIKIKEMLNKFFTKIKKNNEKIIGYGAPAKATTLISFLRINKDKINFIVDKNPLKKNKFMPGSRIPIYSIDNIKKYKPKYLFNFAWNFLDEILVQNKFFLKEGGKIVNPIPKFKIYEYKKK